MNKPTFPPHLRVARPCRDLDAATRFYTRALGFEILAAFTGQAGIDGVILGHHGWPYHLELRQRRTEPFVPRPTEDDLLVFYLPEAAAWNDAVERILSTGARAVPPWNPYWDDRGLTFEDPDGYRIMLENGPCPWMPAMTLRPAISNLR